LLPATGWGEKNGTVTNSERRISRQRALIKPVGEAKDDWWIMTQVAQRLGFSEAFPYRSPRDVFVEHAALSGFRNGGKRIFNISGLSELSEQQYNDLSPIQWPVTAESPAGTARLFTEGGFVTASGKAQFIAIAPRLPVQPLSVTYPCALNTGRIRDQWHTMTRTAKSPRLSAHLPEPFLEIHPKDARALGLKPAALVRVANDHGAAILRALVTDAVRPGQVFAPMHWTGETAPSARVDALVPGHVDPVSGQPESKAATVSVEPFEAAWYGFAVSSRDLSPKANYWTRSRTDAGYRAELAGLTAPANWEGFARDLFDTRAEVQVVEDPTRGIHRFAFTAKGRLEAALFISREPAAITRDYLAGLVGTDAPAALSGRAPADMPDPGPTICSCFGVGLNTIVAAIEEHRLMSVDAIGAQLQAGTNCGSCRAELGALLEAHLRPQAAE